MYKKLMSRIHIPVLLTLLFLFSTVNAHGLVFTICYEGKLYVTVIDSGGVFSYVPGTECALGLPRFDTVRFERVFGIGPYALIPRPKPEEEFLEGLKKFPVQDLKPLAGADKINDKLLDKILSPGVEVILYSPGELPPYLEELAEKSTARANFNIKAVYAGNNCSPGYGFCRIRAGDNKGNVELAPNDSAVSAVGFYDKNRMTLFFPGGLMPTRKIVDSISISNNILFSKEQAQAMGAKSFTVLKGNYKIRTINQKQAVTVNIKMK